MQNTYHYLQVLQRSVHHLRSLPGVLTGESSLVIQLSVLLIQILKFCVKTHIPIHLFNYWHLGWASSFVQACSPSCSLSQEAAVCGLPGLVPRSLVSSQFCQWRIPLGCQRQGELCHLVSFTWYTPQDVALAWDCSSRSLSYAELFLLSSLSPLIHSGLVVELVGLLLALTSYSTFWGSLRSYKHPWN